MPSLVGLAQAAEIPGLGAYLAGLWEHNLFQSVGYYPVGLESARTPTRYRGPSWSWPSWDCPALHLSCCSWTKTPPTPEWYQWANRFAPKLVSHSMLPKNSLDPRGELLEGSHIVLQGFCRRVYIEETNSVFDPRAFGCKNYCARGDELRDPITGALKPQIEQLGRHVRMDQMENQKHSIAYFGEDLKDRPVSTDDIRQYRCLQIGKQWRENNTQVVALILDQVGETDSTPPAWFRVGIMTLDESDWDRPDWEAETFKFI